MKYELMSNDQSGCVDDMIPLCLRPDVLVMLPLLTQFPLPRQPIRTDTSVRNTTTHQIHKPIPGYDHE
jgi:hypothetical protein